MSQFVCNIFSLLTDGQGRPSEQTDSETKPESVTSANSSMSQGEMDEGEEEEGQASETKKKPKKERGKKKDKNRKDRNKGKKDISTICTFNQ